MDKEDVKAVIKGLLISSTKQMTVRDLVKDFRSLNGASIPTFEYRTVEEFLHSLSDTVVIIRGYVYPVSSERSAHIEELVSQQKISRSGGPGRRICSFNPQVIPRFRSSHALPLVPAGLTQRISTNQTEQIAPRTQGQTYIASPVFRHEIPQVLTPRVTRLDKPYPAVNTDGNKISSLLELNLNDPRIKTQPNISRTQTYRSEQPLKPVQLSEITKINLKILLNSNKHFGVSYEELIEYIGDRYWYGQQKSMNQKINEIISQCPFLIIRNMRIYCVDSLENEESKSKGSSGSIKVNNTVKQNLRQLLKQHPDGVWCSEIPQLYEYKYKQTLDYREFSCISLIQMLSAIPDVAQCVRPAACDWKVFPADVRLPEAYLQQKPSIPKYVQENILNLLSLPCYDCDHGGLPVDRLLSAYSKMYGTELDVREFNCSNLDVFIQELDNKIIKLRMVNRVHVLLPLLKRRTNSGSDGECVDALPNIGPDMECFSGLFPIYVLGPQDVIPVVDLTEIAVPNNRILVRVAEVWSPYRFSLQLENMQDVLNETMDELQIFYGEHNSGYIMPGPTIQPEQFCACYCGTRQSEPEWHRGKIVATRPNNCVSCLLVDYGTTVRLNVNKLRFLHKKFGEHQAMSFEARLDGVQPVDGGDKWPKEASLKFLHLVTGKTLAADVIKVNLSKPWMRVKLTDVTSSHNRLLANMLISEKQAKRKVEEPEWVQEEEQVTQLPSTTSKTTNDDVCHASFEEVKILNNVVEDGEKASPDYLFPTDTITSEAPPPSPPAAIVPPTVQQPPPLSGKVPPGFHATVPTGYPTQPTVYPQLLLQQQQQQLLLQQQMLMNQPQLLLNTQQPSMTSMVGWYQQTAQAQLDRRNEITQLTAYFFCNHARIVALSTTNPELAMQQAAKLAEDIMSAQNMGGTAASLPLTQQLPLLYQQQLQQPPAVQWSTVNQQTTVKPPSTSPVVMHPPSPVNVRRESAGASGASKHYESGYTIVDADCETEHADMDISCVDDQDPVAEVERVQLKLAVKLEVSSRLIHVLNVDDELYVCLNEIVDLFTIFNTVDEVLRFLRRKHIEFEYLDMYRDLDGEFFLHFDKYKFRGFTTQYVNQVKLLKLKSCQQFLQNLGALKSDVVVGFNRLLEQVTPDDDCWYKKS